MTEQLFHKRNDVCVVAVVGNADDVWRALDHWNPDVITLDLAMPGMDGEGFLARVMRERPMPVVIVSSSSRAGSELCSKLLRMGASACFDKADIGSRSADFLKIVKTVKRGTFAGMLTPGDAGGA